MNLMYNVTKLLKFKTNGITWPCANECLYKIDGDGK